MTTGSDLELLDQHFAFGENWADFAARIDESRIEQAGADLERLVSRERLAGRSFIDIGCGSGLHSLAALRLGAREVRGYDLDPVSVKTTHALLTARAPEDARWSATERSVFDLDPADGRADIVYSWGVLHHTGSMWPAVERAAAMVDEGGTLVIALYLRTPLCPLWRIEKALYAHGGPLVQLPLRLGFKAFLMLGMLARGKNPLRRIRDYDTRGMSWHHDIHDWLGGYPYESASPDDTRQRVEALGFRQTASYATAFRWGIVSNACAEYVFERT